MCKGPAGSRVFDLFEEEWDDQCCWKRTTEDKVIENGTNDQSRYCCTLMKSVLIFPYDFLFNWLASSTKSFTRIYRNAFP